MLSLLMTCIRNGRARTDDRIVNGPFIVALRDLPCSLHAAAKSEDGRAAFQQKLKGISRPILIHNAAHRPATGDAGAMTTPNRHPNH